MTPTGVSTPLAREWDSSSLHNDNNSTANASIGQGNSVEFFRDMVHKRIMTLTYIRSMHQGQSHWFHTIMVTRADLEREFNNTVMKKRTHRFAVLSMSLANLLDINAPQDLLRGVLNTLAEYDQSKVDKELDPDSSSSRPNLRRGIFRPKIKRPGGIADSYNVADTSGDPSYLITPHLPFALDYHQTVISLLDVLSEVYNKIGKIFGPSPFPHTTQHMVLGSLLPAPGVSYIFTDGTHPNSYHGDTSDGSLWSIANAGIVVGNTFSYGQQNVNGLGEMVVKIDGKLKVRVFFCV